MDHFRTNDIIFVVNYNLFMLCMIQNIRKILKYNNKNRVNRLHRILRQMNIYECIDTLFILEDCNLSYIQLIKFNYGTC